MNCAVLFIRCSILIAFYVYCARDLPARFQNHYNGYNCFLLNEENSKLYISPTVPRVLPIKLDRICLKNDIPKWYKFSSVLGSFKLIEKTFDDVHIVRMDHKNVTLYVRLNELDSYRYVNVEFKDYNKVDEFIWEIFDDEHYPRIDVSELLMVERIRRYTNDDDNSFYWQKYDQRPSAKLKYVEYLNDDGRTFIIFASDIGDDLNPSNSEISLKAYIAFSRGGFQLSKVENGKILMMIEGFNESYYILTFSQEEDQDAVNFRQSISEFASTKDELPIPPEMRQFFPINDD